MIIRNITRNTVLTNQCDHARSFFARLKGLQLKKDLPAGSGMLITPCNSIHMFFMRFPIDAIFLDKDQNVLYIEEDIKPWRISKVIKNSRSVLELPAGTAKATGTILCDRLEINQAAST
jgi:uncharacterized protein